MVELDSGRTPLELEEQASEFVDVRAEFLTLVSYFNYAALGNLSPMIIHLYYHGGHVSFDR